MKREEYLAGLDVGSSNICAVIGNLDSENRVDILGIGCAGTRGMRQGIVVDPGELSGSIEQAVSEAEGRAKCRLHSVFAGTSAAEIRTRHHKEVVTLSGPERCIRRKDIEKAARLAGADSLPLEESILRTELQGYVVDDQEAVKNPLGMFGTRLTVELLHVSAPAAAVENLSNCINQVGLEVKGILPSGLASAYSTLTDEEKNEGAILIDFGGETTQVVVFDEGTMKEIQVLPRGGNYLTEGKRSPNQVAEVRMKEILSEVGKVLARAASPSSAVSSLVITGGGSLLEGAAEMTGNYFDLPVRTGVAHRVRGAEEIITSPVSTAAIGLIHYGAGERRRERNWAQKIPIVNRLVTRFKDLMEEYF